MRQMRQFFGIQNHADIANQTICDFKREDGIGLAVNACYDTQTTIDVGA